MSDKILTHMDAVKWNEIKYFPDSIFKVYIRRQNSQKRLIYKGKSIENALTSFYDFKVFKGEYKYLYSINPLLSETETLIYRSTGEHK